MSYRRLILILIYVLFFTPPSCVRRKVVTRNAVPGKKAYRSTSPSRLSEHIRSVIKISSRNTPAEQKRLEGFLGHHPELASLYRRVAQKPDDLDSRRMLAHGYMNKRLYLHAFQLYQEIQVRTGPDPDLERAIARIWDEWGDYSIAWQYAERALAMDPNSTDSLELLGRIHLHRNDPDAAIAAFSKALEIAPQNASLRAHLGSAFLLKEDWKQAGNHLERAAQPQPAPLETREKLGMARVSLTESNPAERDPSTENSPALALKSPEAPAQVKYPTVVYLSLPELTPADLLTDDKGHSGQFVESRKSQTPAEATGDPDHSTRKQFPMKVKIAATTNPLEVLHDNSPLNLPRRPDLRKNTVQVKLGIDSIIEAAGRSLLPQLRTRELTSYHFNPTAVVFPDPFKLRSTLKLTPGWNSQSTIIASLRPTAVGDPQGSSAVFPFTLIAFLLGITIVPIASRKHPRSVSGRSQHSVPKHRRVNGSKEKKSSRGDSEGKHGAHQITKKESHTAKLCDSVPEQTSLSPGTRAAMDGFTKTENPRATGADLKNKNRKISRTHVFAGILFAFALVLLKREWKSANVPS